MPQRSKTRSMRVNGYRCKTNLKRVGRVHGRGKVWDWIKNTALPWVKKNHLISKGLNMLGPYGQIAGTAAGALGWGSGRGYAANAIKKHATMANLKKAHSYVKDNKYISRGLLHYSKPGSAAHNAGKFAKSVGYGRRHALSRAIKRSGKPGSAANAFGQWVGAIGLGRGGSLGGTVGYGKKKICCQ